MKNLLYIETSTKNCSVAISSDYNLIAFKELNSENYSHSENLHVFINDILEQAKIDINDLNGVVIGKGPGSYTGLRIGTACAKGLCYSLEIPLISINSLEIMAERIFPISNQLGVHAGTDGADPHRRGRTTRAPRRPRHRHCREGSWRCKILR